MLLNADHQDQSDIIDHEFSGHSVGVKERES